MAEESPNETGGPAAENAPAARCCCWKRALLRLAIFAAGFVFLLFPHPGRALHEIQTLRDPNALIAPEDPAVGKLSGDIDAAMPKTLDRPHQVAWIERYVEKRIEYANDWDQWLNVDYWPTPAETLASGREDCDGIAVVTASLLRHRGFRCRIEASYEHVWVEVEGARILHPDKETDFDGEHWSMPGLKLILPWLRYSLSEFPLWRWGTIVAWTVVVLRWPNRRRIAWEFAAAFGAIAIATLAARTLPTALFAGVLIVVAGILTSLRALGRTLGQPGQRP